MLALGLFHCCGCQPITPLFPRPAPASTLRGKTLGTAAPWRSLRRMQGFDDLPPLIQLADRSMGLKLC